MHWLPAILILPYLVLLLKIFRSLLKIKPFLIKGNPSTNVSVVVACRNEQEKLPALLESLSSQDYSTHLCEIIVVNDNSDDRTFDIASSFKSNIKITAVNNSGSGKKKALETGINIATGSLIITTDADCTTGKNWIRTIASFYENRKPDLIICPVMLKPIPGVFGKFQELEFLSLQGITAGSAKNGNGTICNGANLAFTKDAYLNHSGNLKSGIRSGDDIFLLHSMKKDPNSKILWLESGDALAIADSSPTIPAFFRQRKRWISKSSSYSDSYTILLGIVTFVTILFLVSLTAAAFFNSNFIPVLLIVLIIKSIPDFLILFNTTIRYNKIRLMNLFIPAQLVYPFYVIGVVVYSVIIPET